MHILKWLGIDGAATLCTEYMSVCFKAFMQCCKFKQRMKVIHEDCSTL